MYAIAGLRGGSEEGEQWHRDGMLGRRQNVFDDLHAAAEHLISAGITSPSRLAVWGGRGDCRGGRPQRAVYEHPHMFRVRSRRPAVRR